MMLTVHEIKSLKEIPYMPSTKLTVLNISPIESSNGKSKFYAILADDTESISATIYNEKEHDKFIVGFGVTMLNILCKSSFIGVTVRTEVAMCQAVIVPNDIKTAAPKLPGNAVHSNEKALASPEKSVKSVKGKITKVSSPLKKMVRDGEIPFQDITLKDKTGQIKVALWDELVGNVQKGQTVSIAKCRVKLFREEKKLSTTSVSTTEVFTTDDDHFNVSEDEEEDQTDVDIESRMPSGVIEAVLIVTHIYPALLDLATTQS